ncbi:hypothetical protein QQP08_022888 [Theobroma cacao]|nr:hypothetical protein QQP08_022888 [Theobroma cacao]
MIKDDNQVYLDRPGTVQCIYEAPDKFASTEWQASPFPRKSALNQPICIVMFQHLVYAHEKSMHRFNHFLLRQSIYGF